jgi:hypothetical protein
MESRNTHRNAIAYTLRELGRRAGASGEFLAHWRVNVEESSVTLRPSADSDASVVFPYDPAKSVRFSALRTAPAVRYGWMATSGEDLRSRVADFAVLFEDAPQKSSALFTRTGPQAFRCEADILTSALWTLGRFEELQPHTADEHGRFPADACAAFKAGCLERPIVDEYGLALQDVLTHLLPAWKPVKREFRVKLSHDIDLTGLPFRFTTTVGHVYPRRIPQAFLRDLLALGNAALPAYLEAIVRTARISQSRGLQSAFYWQTTAPSSWDAGYDIEDTRIRNVIERLTAHGFEMGLHPGYSTFGSLERLQEEVARIRRVIGEGPIGGRQHYLRWRPATWKAWEDAGLAYDSTVGFADAMGFRAGTCIPYRPWLFDEERESRILEIPLVVMDCTPVRYMNLDDAETLRRIDRLIRRCKAVGGVFTLLWHNASVIERPYAKMYPRILDKLAAPSYDWRSDAASYPSRADAAVRAVPFA